MLNPLLATISSVYIALIVVAGVVFVAAVVAIILLAVKKKHDPQVKISIQLPLPAPTQPAAAEESPAEKPAEQPAQEPEKKEAPAFMGFRTFVLNKSFTAKLIQLDDVSKGWYSALKNEILSYRKVRDRMSWKRESFRLGRKCAARFVIRGKRLCLQLALSAGEYAGTKYRVEDISHVKSSADTPSLYRIKTDRRAEYAKKLIADVMAQIGAEQGTPLQENYVLPFESTEELIARGLIKQITVVMPVAEGDEELNKFVEDEATVAVHGVKAAIPVEEEQEYDTFDDEANFNTTEEPVAEEVPVEEVSEEVLVEEVPEEPVEEEPVEEIPEEPVEEEPMEEVPVEEPVEEIPVEEPVEEEPVEEPVQEEIAVQFDEYIEEDFEDEDEQEEEIEETEELAEQVIEEVAEEQPEEAPQAVPEKKEEKEEHYDKSFIAKVVQLSDTSKRWYSKLKNELLSYGNISDVLSWKRESFRLNNTYVARFMVRGKTLCLLLALDPKKYGEAKQGVLDVSKVHACEDTPSMLRLKNERSVKHAIHLIAEAMRKAGTHKVPHEERDYYIPYATTAKLIEQGFVRSSGKKHK